MAWQNWLDQAIMKLGYVRGERPDHRRFNREVGDPSKIVRQQGYDGVQLCTGKDTVYVKYDLTECNWDTRPKAVVKHLLGFTAE